MKTKTGIIYSTGTEKAYEIRIDGFHEAIVYANSRREAIAMHKTEQPGRVLYCRIQKTEVEA